MPTINAVLVAFNNPDQTLTRWRRDLIHGLVQTDHQTEFTVVDNSALPSDRLAAVFGAGYLWQGGANLQYGPALNLAVKRVESDFIVYTCSCHGYAVDHSWVRDLLEPFRDPEVAMTGHLRGSNSPEGVAHDLGLPWIKEKYQFKHPDGRDGHVPQHIQGGVFMSRTSALLDHPYPDDVPHLFTDHVMTWELLKAGLKCVDVPSVVSVWREVLHDRRGVKYVHDLSPEATRVE